MLSESAGTSTRDYIWLDGMPVGIVDHAGITASVNFVHADGLGSPRAVTNSSGTVLWQWVYASNPFGERAPVSSTGYTLNLRFPGQYFDADSGLNYNINRDYDAASGRYLQSDPLGLAAGTSTYAYAASYPLAVIAPLGLYCLKEWQIRGIAGAVVGGIVGGLAGSETGPGAAATAGVGAVVNGSAGVVDGLINGEGAGASTGTMGGMAGAGNKGDFVGGIPGSAIGGALASNMEDRGYSRPMSNTTGGAVGGSLGSAISGYLRGLSVGGIAKGAARGGAIGLAASATQAGLEAAIRAGNHCPCNP